MGALAERTMRAVAAWNGGDLAGYLDLYDETISLHGYSPAPMGKAEVVGFYQGIFQALKPVGSKSPQLDLHHVIETGDWVANNFTMRGEQTGAFMGVPASGRPFAITGVTMLRFNPARRVVERHTAADFLGLMIQIGAIPPPG